MPWRKRFFPNLIVESITDINVSDLPEIGIKGVLLDTDGTLTHLNSDEISDDFIQWIDQSRSIIPIQIVTCNHQRKYLDQIKSLTDIKPLRRKPWEVPSNFFRRSALEIGCHPSQIAIINDSLLMLGFFARPLGCYTIKVSSIDSHLEHSLVGYSYRIGQWLEEKFIHPKLISSS